MPTSEPESALSVPRWIDVLSGLQARHPGFWRGLGRLEDRLLVDRLADVTIVKPIYIAGLARSGTTILLELLARHPDLASHRYRDFPPVLTPWFWNWFVDHAGSTEEKSVERAHRDGIKVTSESPEAFEEVVWMAFFPDLHNPGTSAVLSSDTRNKEFETFYREHIRKLLFIRGGRRYLAKGNYNVTRLGYLQRLFPDARFLLPVRDPVWHIASLMRQHEWFCGEHARDARLMRHMSRGGHFEFGLDRRPVNCGNSDTTREIQQLWSNGREVEGWALYWKDIYGTVAAILGRDETLRDATLLIDYEEFCSKPAAVMRQLLAHCDLASTEIDLAALAADTIHPSSRYTPPFDDEQLALIRQVTDPVTQQLETLATRTTSAARAVAD